MPKTISREGPLWSTFNDYPEREYVLSRTEMVGISKRRLRYSLICIEIYRSS